MNKNIDFGRIETWPERLKQLVFHNSEKISVEKKADFDNILAGKAHYHSVSMPTYDSAKSKIEELLLDSSALAWHCTNLINPEKIKTNGLHPLSVALIKDLIQTEMVNILDQKDQEIIIKKIKEYERDDFFGSRENQLWFLLNKEMWSDTGCKEFFSFFGGEAMRRIIENDLPRYKSVFQSVGKPYLIEFHVELNQIESYQLSNLADQLINFGIDSLNTEKTPFIYAEGKITKTIVPDRILKIYAI
jgi:hypothetical protein